jgi:hypothetical protein
VLATALEWLAPGADRRTMQAAVASISVILREDAELGPRW